METKVKKLKRKAVVPKRAHNTDVGYDVYAIDYEVKLRDDDGNIRPQVTLKTGLAMTPPAGHYWELFPRSSVSKTVLQLANSVGIIDPEYTGEIQFKFNFIATPTNSAKESEPVTSDLIYENYIADIFKRNKGKWKIGQLVLRERKSSTFRTVKSLEETTRGDGGFGSTDKK